MSQSGGLPHIKGKSRHLENNIIISKHRHPCLDFFWGEWVGVQRLSMDFCGLVEWKSKTVENISDANEK